MALASLTPSEIQYAARAFAAACGSAESLVFYEVALDESFTTEQKEAALSDEAAMLRLPRRARVVASQPASRTVYEGTAPVDEARSGEPAIIRPRSGVQPAPSGGALTFGA